LVLQYTLMILEYIDIKNFRGISKGKIFFNGHSVIIGDNNAGKSTIFEAIDLVLGPERLNKVPVVDEHDFYRGEYFFEEGSSPEIEIELLVSQLEASQLNLFKYHVEFWDSLTKTVIGVDSINQIDKSHVKEALRLKFEGRYNPDDDDFEGKSFFCSPQNEDGSFNTFTKSHKRECGFLYLRALRTGARALSLERGSLLDIILRLREIRPKMWEDVLSQLKTTTVATDPSLGISEILGGIQSALREFVPSEWGSDPQLKVSDLTREHLRKTLTVFMSTGAGAYHAPFQHQGTGTVNTMVLALLSMIAELKKNVIFAMEEPEIAIPPYTQKRIVDSIRKKSTQAIFTSHSPFVLEEFLPSQIILIQRNQEGVVDSQSVQFPSIIKPKHYDTEFRLRFAEALLAKRILLTEGLTEATAYSAAGRKLNELASAEYSSLEAMGISIFNVMSQSSVSMYGDYFKALGKTVFAVFDKQSPNELAKITSAVMHPFESPYNGFEELLLNETDETILQEFYKNIISQDGWPTHLLNFKASDDNDADQLKKALGRYLRWSKGSKSSAELISLAKRETQIPQTIRAVLKKIKLETEKISEPEENSNE
jgi:putative ATP-dependent endonuclease of the OLD family